LKRLIVLACFAVLFAPGVTQAQDWWWWGGHDRDHHHHINGDEMAVAGFAGAALLAGVGYLALRRRQTEQQS
jgi:LPXTG-motif cell wall-anchored protein